MKKIDVKLLESIKSDFVKEFDNDPSIKRILNVFINEVKSRSCIDRSDIGLMNKYNLTRTDGKGINPNNEYFVLKLKGDGDDFHKEACIKALETYALEISSELPALSEDLFKLYINK